MSVRITFQVTMFLDVDTDSGEIDRCVVLTPNVATMKEVGFIDNIDEIPCHVTEKAFEIIDGADWPTVELES